MNAQSSLFDPIPPADGIENGDRVRWRTAPHCPWNTGVVKGRNRDGSLHVIDSYNGASRSVHPWAHGMERQVIGRRGRPVWRKKP